MKTRNNGMARVLIIVSVLLFAAVTVSGARAENLGPLTPDDIVRVHFRMTDYVPYGTPGDILWAEINVTSPGYTWSTTAHLYDGDTLLGVHTSTRYGDLGPNVFIKPDSIYAYNDPTAVDFTTIDNKTIDGRIDFQVSGGSLWMFDSEWLDIGIYQAVNAMGRTVDAPSDVATIEILSVQKVPEPGMLGMLAILGLAVLSRRFAVG